MPVLPLIALAPTSCESVFKILELICGSGNDSSPHWLVLPRLGALGTSLEQIATWHLCTDGELL